MSDEKCDAVPLLELARRIPKDFRGEWEIQWHEDGTPSGHAMAPVGRYVHQLADRIEELEATLSVGSEECQRFSDQVDYLGAEVERLQELTANDGKEIGSYREGTGLRGENRRLEAEVERLRAMLQEMIDMQHQPEEYRLNSVERARVLLAAVQETDNDT